MMTTTFTDTFNRDDVRRVYAAFAAEYRIAAEWTGLHSATFVAKTIEQIARLAEEQYLREVHLQLISSTGQIREATRYRVSTNASGWSSDRPGDIYWLSYNGDRLIVIVDFSDKWWALTQEERDLFSAIYMSGWEESQFDGNYGTMSSSTNRHYASRAYGLERTDYKA